MSVNARMLCIIKPIVCDVLAHCCLCSYIFSPQYNVHAYVYVISSCCTILCTIIPLYISFTADVPQCPELPFFPNGAITYDPDMTAPHDVDTVATHTCDPGFVLIGSETRVCLEARRWTGLFPPVCRRT